MESWLIILLALSLVVVVAALAFDRLYKPDPNDDSLAAFFTEGLLMVIAALQFFLGLALAFTTELIGGLLLSVMGVVVITVVIRQIRRKTRTDEDPA